MKRLFYIFALLALGCQAQKTYKGINLVVLGTIQDAGSPHIGCQKKCCELLFEQPDETRKVVSLGLIDTENNKTFLFEASPDMPSQLKMLKAQAKGSKKIPDGIFLTHAHIGHYTGLMYLGREALGAHRATVYAMPKMRAFLKANGPWSQLIALENIVFGQLENEKKVQLTNSVVVIPFTVPHRDEFSETVGYKIIGPEKAALFIPDIDKWSKWEKSIIREIKQVDYAFLDASFFDGNEINNRDISEIPHPFVIESMALFESLSTIEKNKIHFIHFNHTNPLLNSDSEEARQVLQKGYRIAKFGDRFKL